MPTIISFASGKGGVGKSVTVSNLGLALASAGHKVVIVDCDLGGGNLETLFGAFEPGLSLDDFLNRKISTLDKALRPVRPNLSLISGAGESLATANPNWAMKQRLLRQLRTLETEIVLLDVGAGAGNNALDFYCAGDLRVLVTLPEPTASVDAYRFLKLASVRESATRVSGRSPERRQLERSNPNQLREVWENHPMVAKGAVPPLRTEPPYVILNQASDATRSFKRLRIVSRKFLERDLTFLGQIPRDAAISDSVAQFLPVIEASADSPASVAYGEIAQTLAQKIQELQNGAIGSASPLPDLAGLVGEAEREAEQSSAPSPSPRKRRRPSPGGAAPSPSAR